METTRETTGTPPREGLVADLCRLLEAQMTQVREGNLSRVEQLGEQANVLVAQIASVWRASPSLAAGEREHLRELYAALMLALKGERQDVGERLKRLGAVTKTLGAYRRGLRNT